MNDNLTIIAGPCSIDESNISDIYDIAKITIKNKKGQIKRAVAGTRIVGLKSRTNLSLDDNIFSGIDKNSYLENLNKFFSGSGSKLTIPPSVIIAKRIIGETNLLVASEVVSPLLQMSFYQQFPKEKLLFWNPSVNQLGWSVHETAKYCKRGDWFLGLKNGRWLGEGVSYATRGSMETTIERTWCGLVSYSGMKKEKTILIHRGVDVPGKGLYRNLPVHKIAGRVKIKIGCSLFFDPSHVFGSKLKNKIVDLTVDAMKLKLNKNEYLYDGILIEVGHSQTDTRQHISIDDLRRLIYELAKFRSLVSPSKKIN